MRNVRKGRKVVYPKETVYESGLKGPIGIALSYLKESEPHYHKKTTEWYLVMKGTATAYINKKKIDLKKYDIIMIPPKATHYAKSRGTVELWVVSYPFWRKTDHYKID